MWTANLDPEPEDQRAAEMPIRIPAKITPQEAITLQRKLAPLVKETDEFPRKHLPLVGCDATYIDGTTVAAAVSIDYENLTVKHIRTIEAPTTFPYIPGLLAFREGSAVVRAIRALRLRSYVCMVDGHGLAHPRRFGLACFVGLALDRPTIGVAKGLLYGSVRDNRVVDREGHPIAELITLPDSGRTIYVSVGHRISLKHAVVVVKRCLTTQGPLPIRLAHEEVTKRKWEIRKSKQVSS
jgi:deoxyribonuclease V